MHRKLLIIFAIIIAIPAVAQDAKKDSVVYGWTNYLLTQLTLSQTSYTDWVQGGDNALSYNSLIDGKETDDLEKSNWVTAYKLAYGQARLGGLGLRKTEDLINLESVYTLKLTTYVNPYASVTFKTQSGTGYTYDKDNQRTAVSDLFDPAYITQGLGAGYQPLKEVKTRLGVALREIITNQYNNYADDPATPAIEKTKIDGGFQLGVEVNWTFYENMTYTSKLDLFDAVKKLDQVIVHWDNTLAMRVNRYISVNATANVINEAAVSPMTQIKETIGLAIGYNFFE